MSIRLACSEFMKLMSCWPRFSTPQVWLFDIVLTAIFTHMLANKVSCRMCREWIVSRCDMHRLNHWYNAFEACTKTWHLQIWYYSFRWLNKLYTHCARLHLISRHRIFDDFIFICIISNHIRWYHITPYHNVSYCIILYNIMSYHICSRIINNLDTATLCFDLCNNFHVPGWSDRKRLGRLGQLHSISFARIREWTRRAGARGFLGSRRLYRRRKRGGLQATSRHRDQAWSHFDVGHHGIHHPSDLDLLKLRLKSFKDHFSKDQQSMFFVNVHFCNSTMVGWTYWQYFFLECIPVKQSPGDHWQIPWLLVSIRRFEVRRCA